MKTKDRMEEVGQLTDAERNALEYILGYFDDNDSFPTTRKLAELLGVYQSWACKLIVNLEAKGWIEKVEHGKWRRTSKCIEIYYPNRA